MRSVIAAVAIGVVAALVASHPADAYVAPTGTGAKSAAVTAGQPLTVSGSTAVFGNNAKTTDPPVPVGIALSNPNTFHRWAHTVTVTFGSSSKAGCTAASYQINGAPLAVDKAVPRGAGTLTVSGVSVGLLAAGCKGSTVTLVYAVS